jgi:nicotinate-nucleotide pyrophosphorylase (carboxylating)
MRDLDPPSDAVEDAVRRALQEDLGILGDLTVVALIPEGTIGTGTFVTKASGIIAGTACASEVFRQLSASAGVSWRVVDGEEVESGQELGAVEGDLRAILTGERAALNFLRHLSGVASLTRRFVRAARGQARILDTRKTTPGLRALEKAAVRAGGGFNHRQGLSDAVMIKDNHITQLAIAHAVQRARNRWPMRSIEVECDTLEQVAEAKAAGADVIMLDNMDPEQVADAVKIIDGAAKIEVSGGVNLETVAGYAAAGADMISIGAITHSAPALDIGLDVR